jgi:hypothetical protein
MTLILNSDDVKQVLAMEVTMNVLEQAYTELPARRRCAGLASTFRSRPRIPTRLINGAPWKADRCPAISR